MLKNTKAVFASSLKKMLEKKTLDHITVKDIVQDCGVSRQAFYYHFNDIYQLVEWIFKEETLEALADNRDIDTWQQGYRHILERMCQ
ncbi:MAG: TetR family transcriptional regulator, partial [Bacillota bacterium]|nr:TetR family transcriptional regulator [Bacillota bacterium]